MKKRKEEAAEEAKLALKEYESSLKQLEDTDVAENTQVGNVSGRRVFGASKTQVTEPNNKIKSDNNYSSSDSEDEFRDKEDYTGLGRTNVVQKDVNVNSVLLSEDSGTRRDSEFKVMRFLDCFGHSWSLFTSFRKLTCFWFTEF